MNYILIKSFKKKALPPLSELYSYFFIVSKPKCFGRIVFTNYIIKSFKS